MTFDESSSNWTPHAGIDGRAGPSPPPWRSPPLSRDPTPPPVAGPPTSATPTQVPVVDMLTFTFAVEPVPGYQVAYQSRGVGQQQAALFAADEQPYYLTVYSRAMFTGEIAGDPVEVGGVRAFFSPRTAVGCTGDKSGARLLWEYAPESWARIEQPAGTGSDEDRMVRLAEAVNFGRTTPVRLPLKAGSLPYGLRPTKYEELTRGLAEPSEPSATITLQNSGEKTVYLRITAYRGEDVAFCGPSAWTSSQRVVHHGAYTVILEGLPDQYLEQVANEIEFVGDGTDQRTWPVAAEALPII